MSIRSKIQSLISAANAKTGESDATLTDAVQTLVDGYGQGGGGYTDSLIDRTITSISWNGQSIGGFAFAGASRLTSISFPNVTSVAGNAFSGTGITVLTEDMFPSLTEITNTDAFWSMPSLTRVFFPSKSISIYAYRVFRNCSKLVTAVIKSVGPSTFDSCAKLTAADITDGDVGDWAFGGCSLLSTLVLRKATIASLRSTGAFNNTPFKNGGSGGTIYIPKALYDHLGDGSSLDYKAATNWSTIDGYGTITWAKIEGSIYETQYADGTPIA